MEAKVNTQIHINTMRLQIQLVDLTVIAKDIARTHRANKFTKIFSMTHLLLL